MSVAFTESLKHYDVGNSPKFCYDAATFQGQSNALFMIRPIHYHHMFIAALIIASIGLLIDLGAPSAPSFIPHKDKAIHFMIFAVLTWLGLHAYRSKMLTVLIGLALYGVATEVAQGMTSYRSASVADWLFDLLGIVTAFYAMRKIKSRQSIASQHKNKQ